MPNRRDIDERDIDRLLAALTDTQIASLYGMSEVEVHRLRRRRRASSSITRPKPSDGASET